VGHIQPESAPEGAKRTRLKPWQKGPLADNRLWALWREVMALYPLSHSLIAGLSPSSPFRRETSWFWFDVVFGLRAMKSSRAIAQRLSTVTEAELDGLIVIGEINSRRQEHFFRSLVLAYITVPLTVGAIWAQLAPDSLVGLATAILIRFVADWRARSFLAVLTMIRAERAVDRP